MSKPNNRDRRWYQYRIIQLEEDNQRLRGLLREINQTVKICPICGAERWYWDISGADKKVRRGSKIAHHDYCELAKELSDET